MEPVSRRTVLRGAGVALSLPFLEAMQPRSARAAAKRPVRFAALYMPNGVNPHHWTPKETGSSYALTELLAPLEKVKGEINVLTELMNKGSIEGDGHYYKVAPLLTGTTITKTTGKELRCGGVSLDQVIAQRLGNLTPLPSLELSLEAPWTFVDTNVGLTTLYGGHISWSSPTTPVSREIDPRAAFERLFKRGSGPQTDLSRDKSVLDAVLDDAKRLHGQISSQDRVKLAEYLDAVRAVERRIAFDAVQRRATILDNPLLRKEKEELDRRIRLFQEHLQGKKNAAYKPASDWKEIEGFGYEFVPEQASINHTEQTRIMLDLIALAFWSDSTRVATFMFGNEVTGRNFSFLKGVNGGHHEISHHENKPEKLEQYKRIGIWHTAQYAYLLERLKGMTDEVGQSVLDNSMILLAGGMRDGNAHSPYDLPVVLGGKGGGTIVTGQHRRYAERTPLCNLHLSVLKRMGVPAVKFGDSTGELSLG
jgi:hypothetical protein